jgi:hypothetical protein
MYIALNTLYTVHPVLTLYTHRVLYRLHRDAHDARISSIYFISLSPNLKVSKQHHHNHNYNYNYNCSFNRIQRTIFHNTLRTNLTAWAAYPIPPRTTRLVLVVQSRLSLSMVAPASRHSSLGPRHHDGSLGSRRYSIHRSQPHRLSHLPSASVESVDSCFQQATFQCTAVG